MIRTNSFLRVLFVLALICVGVVYAEERPMHDVDPAKHPNIAAAQDLIGKAWEKTVEAQAANNDELKGHADKAKTLLVEASKELSAAARAAK
jgi:hypothetical protein